MKQWVFTGLLMTAVISSAISPVSAADLPADLKAAIDKATPALTAIASSESVVTAVKQRNESTPPAVAAMTNTKWKSLSILSPEVKSYAKNSVAQYLNKNKPAYVAELFLSAADGTKIAFLSKPTSWTHKGNAKHDLPMQGKHWIGEIETDESTGVKQIQVSLPVLDGKKPIGSIVFGLDIVKVKQVK